MADGTNRLLSAFGSQRHMPLVMQSEAAECALACLAMIASYHGYESDLPSLRRRFSTSLKGVTLARVIQIAHSLSFEARPVRVELGYLTKITTPCMLHWDMNHFVVFRRMTRRGVEIYDPARGTYTMPLAEAGNHFTGVLLQLTPSAKFTKKNIREKVSLSDLTGHITGLKRVIIQVVGLALGIEVFSLLLPFQIQWMLDQVLVTRDTVLLVTLTAGFLIVLGLQTALAVGRSWILSWFGAALDAQWVTNLFSHLLKLPMDFFEKRHIGDIVSRFSSVRSIRATLTGTFIEAVLDGLTGSLALVILAIYSPSLTAIVFTAFVCYALLRWGFYRVLWRFNEEQMVYDARQQTELMESVRGIQAIKLSNRQSERQAKLANATMAAAERGMKSQRIVLAFNAANQGLFGAQRICLIAFGTYLAIKGNLSAGMVVAIVAYADQFTSKIGSLIDKLVEFRLLALHAERIGDIALTPPESNVEGIYAGPVPEPSIEVRDLGFRYSQDEPWVFRNLNLTFAAGESVAITGASGCGKSTLGKVILGLLEPEEGVVLIGGVDIRHLGTRRYRDLISAVTQDDQLFAGTMADNIAFCDAEASIERIMSAAHAAAIHDEIVAMPMGYETFVGDMGSVLSGGQKQRMLIARALYREPRVLLLDEATSHLDSGNCWRIDSKIASLNITRIVIAHRDETIASADRCIAL